MDTHFKTQNAPEGFKRAAIAEWAKLNPCYMQSGDSFGKVLVHAAQETLPGFFAPGKMALWVLGFAARSTWRRVTT